jgi:hypothetical protein
VKRLERVHGVRHLSGDEGAALLRRFEEVANLVPTAVLRRLLEGAQSPAHQRAQQQLMYLLQTGEWPA